MIKKYIDQIDKIRKEVRDEIFNPTTDKSTKEKLTGVFTLLTSVVDKYSESEEENKLTDGTERYHR